MKITLTDMDEHWYHVMAGWILLFAIHQGASAGASLTSGSGSETYESVARISGSAAGLVLWIAAIGFTVLQVMIISNDKQLETPGKRWGVTHLSPDDFVVRAIERAGLYTLFVATVVLFAFITPLSHLDLPGIVVARLTLCALLGSYSLLFFFLVFRGRQKG